MWCDGGSREKILFYILNCVSQEMLFPSSTFKCFTKKIIIIKQTSHSLLSGTYSVYSCYLYVCAMCTKVPVFSYCIPFLAIVCYFVQIFLLCCWFQKWKWMPYGNNVMWIITLIMLLTSNTTYIYFFIHLGHVGYKVYTFW